jgi:hypothetical protein
MRNPTAAPDFVPPWYGLGADLAIALQTGIAAPS